MTTEPMPAGPEAEALISLIRETWPEADVATMPGGAFFSLDPEKHWPNFATIVWTDDFDLASNLTRPGAFRLNIGVGRATFEKLVGGATDPDYTAMDRILPPRCTRDSDGSRFSTQATRPCGTW